MTTITAMMMILILMAVVRKLNAQQDKVVIEPGERDLTTFGPTPPAFPMMPVAPLRPLTNNIQLENRKLTSGKLV